MSSITSVNAVLMFSQAQIFPVPIKLAGFGVDDIYDTETLKNSENMMGVDGILSSGFVFVPIPQNITLMADSPSTFFFDTVYNAEQQAGEKYKIQGVIVLPSIGLKYTMRNGVLDGYKIMPDGKKVLQPRKFTIIWERVTPSTAI